MAHQMCSLVLKTIFHIFAVCLSAFIFVKGQYVREELINSDSDEPMLYGLRNFPAGYATHLNAAFQAVYFLLALTYDVLEWANKTEGCVKKLNYVKNVFFGGIVMPQAFVVTILFWSVYSVKPELIYPDLYDSIMPTYFNHLLHTNILTMVLVEALVEPRRYPTDLKVEWSLMLINAVGYFAMYYAYFFITGHWLYNIHGVLNWWQLILFQLFIWALYVLGYLVVYPFTRMCRGESKQCKLEK